jgi:hypothetical protein
MLVLMVSSGVMEGEPQHAAVVGFDTYVRNLETRLTRQHQSQSGFVAGIDSDASRARLRGGELRIEKLTPENGPDLPGAMLHPWRGSAFVAGARAEDFERMLKDFGAYPAIFAPEVTGASSDGEGDRFHASMRVRQNHGITVVMDTRYDVSFARLDRLHGYSMSRSTQIAEVGSPGTSKEHLLSASEEHGFLWRLNSYWSWEERDGGLYVQIESVSLTRSIPAGLGWIVGPFVESVPRDSLEFTLHSACQAVRNYATRSGST